MKTHKIIILQNAEQGVFMKHKNFVSMAALLILALSAVFLVTACPTGTGPSSGGTLTLPIHRHNELHLLTFLLLKLPLYQPFYVPPFRSCYLYNILLSTYNHTTKKIKIKTFR